jgi:hypothetical protein
VYVGLGHSDLGSFSLGRATRFNQLVSEKYYPAYTGWDRWPFTLPFGLDEGEGVGIFPPRLTFNPCLFLSIS